jgi:Pyruvate/2-oxoacid:ferredoxin oxidoreductase delta subunit
VNKDDMHKKPSSNSVVNKKFCYDLPFCLTFCEENAVRRKVKF